jgi:hypothetical protein
MKNNNEQVFNEGELFTFLNNKEASPFTVHYKHKSSDFKTSLTLAKIDTDNDYTLLLNLGYFRYDHLSEVKMRNNNLDVVAVYFKKLNALVFESSYEMGNLDDLCNDIKIFDSVNLYREIKSKFENEFQSRIPSFKDRYKNEVELIQKKKEQCKESLFKETILESSLQESQLIYDYQYDNRVKNLQMIQDYLKDGSSYIETFVTDYLNETDNKLRAREIACYELAKDEMIQELKDDPIILKAKKIRKLLQSDLGNAKKLWAIDNKGESHQVENHLSISYELVQLGRYYNERVDISNIVALKYSRKQFDVQV